MMMTNEEIWRIAREQSAIDAGCHPDDFLADTNRVVLSKPNDKARRYLKLPLPCDLISYGNNIVASVIEPLKEEVEKYISSYSYVHCFETPNMHVLDRMLEKQGYRVCFMAEYFLPDMRYLKALDCPYEIRVLLPEQFADLYVETWENALLFNDRKRDMLAVGAYDDGKLVGLAGCSADCDTMWQIGIDVLPQYRCQGIASALTSWLALEILERGKVPFYCAAWSNIRSVRNAIRSGFRPAWVEMTAKSIVTVDQMNQI